LARLAPSAASFATDRSAMSSRFSKRKRSDRANSARRCAANDNVAPQKIRQRSPVALLAGFSLVASSAMMGTKVVVKYATKAPGTGASAAIPLIPDPPTMKMRKS
jgi:hypothetical protein